MTQDFTWRTQAMERARLNSLIRRYGLAVAAVAILIVGAVPRADAGLILTLSDGTVPGTVMIADGDPGDSGAGAGVVVYNGSVGAWMINVTTGISKPVLGNSTQPELDLNSINVSGGVGTLTIELADDGFDLGTQAGTLLSDIGGVTAGTITYQALLDGAPIGPNASAAGGSFSDSFTTGVNLTGAFSLANKVTITHSGAFQATSFNFSTMVNVPEPGPLFLMGIALAGIGLRCRWLLAS